MRGLLALLLVLLSVSTASATVYLDDDLDYADQSAFSASSWGVGSKVTLQTSGCQSGNCARIEYLAAGNSPGYSLSRTMSIPATASHGLSERSQ